MEEGMQMPLVQKPWDLRGVRAFRALSDHPKNPMDTLAPATNENGQQEIPCCHNDAKTLVKEIDERYKKVQDIMKDSNLPKPDAMSVKSAEMKKRLEDYMRELHSSDENKKALQQLFALADAYDNLEWCREVRAMSAHRRVVDKLGDRKTPLATQCYYVAFPCMMFACAFSIQSFLLHIATHLYVFYMEEEDKFHEEGHTRLYDIVGNNVGLLSGGKLEGVTASGKFDIPTPALDASGAIPLGLCVFAYMYACYKKRFSIGLWNKTFIVASCMAIIKGVFDVVTIMPDSSGYATCLKRLGNSTHAMYDSDEWAELIALEIFGNNGKRVRYCADMMVSGHTYFATLFAISAYKMTYHSGLGKRSARVVGVVCSFCIIAEFGLVAAARFHYTVDMLAAVLFVMVLFDSTYVEQLASDWSEGFRWREADPEFTKFKSSPFFNRMWRRSCQRSAGVTATQTGSPVADETAPLLPEDDKVIMSRATGLLNLRVIQGHAPWEWRTVEELEKTESKAEEKEIKARDKMASQQQQESSQRGATSSVTPAAGK